MYKIQNNIKCTKSNIIKLKAEEEICRIKENENALSENVCSGRERERERETIFCVCVLMNAQNCFAFNVFSYMIV